MCNHFVGANLANAGIVTARTTIPEFVELGTTIQDDPCIVRHSNEVVAAQSARIPLREEYSAYIEENITEGPACHGNRLDMLSNSTLNPLSTMEHVHSSDVEDAVEIEHPLILSGVDSIPFTYLACLFAKWTTEKDKIPQIHRRIKVTFFILFYNHISNLWPFVILFKFLLKSFDFYFFKTRFVFFLEFCQHSLWCRYPFSCFIMHICIDLLQVQYFKEDLLLFLQAKHLRKLFSWKDYTITPE